MGARPVMPAVAYGGVPVSQYGQQGQRALHDTRFQLVQSDLPEPEWRDPAYCRADGKHGLGQCGARPIRGEELCTAHKRSAEKAARLAAEANSDSE